MEYKFEQLLRKTLSEEETQELLKEIESDSSLKKDFEAYRDTWDVVKTLERRELKDKISRMVNHQSTNQSKNKQWVWYSAASVLVLFLSYWFFIQNISGERMAQNYFEPYPDKYTSMGQNKSLLSEAMAEYNAGNYGEAELLFDQLPEELSDETDLYRGICLYQMDKKQEAKSIFKQLKQDTTHVSYEPAFWYLSMTHLALNEKDSAISILNQINNNSSMSFHKKDAAEIIDQLK